MRITRPIFDPKLIAAFAMETVATAPFEGTLCHGRIFVLDRSSYSSVLALVQIMAARLANALDRETLQNQAKDAAADRERALLTRDLHDGLLQTLTASCLKIKLAVDASDQQGREYLTEIKQLLTDQQRRVRDFRA